MAIGNAAPSILKWLFYSIFWLVVPLGTEAGRLVLMYLVVLFAITMFLAHGYRRHKQEEAEIQAHNQAQWSAYYARLDAYNAGQQHIAEMTEAI